MILIKFLNIRNFWRVVYDKRSKKMQAIMILIEQRLSNG